MPVRGTDDAIEVWSDARLAGFTKGVAGDATNFLRVGLAIFGIGGCQQRIDRGLGGGGCRGLRGGGGTATGEGRGTGLGDSVRR
jgi:hypothetical protein